MANTLTKSTSAELAGILYKNMKMGADIVINLLPKTEDVAMRSHLTEMLDGYEKLARDAKNALDRENEDAREEGVISKMSAKMGINMKTMVDSSSSHIAELLMEGAVMSISETKRELKRFEERGCSHETLQTARDIIAFEEQNLEKAKTFL